MSTIACIRPLALVLVAFWLTFSGNAWAQPLTEDKESKRQEQASEAGTAGGSEEEQPSETEEKLAELERQIQVLAEELEKLRLGEVAEEEPAQGRHGLAPAASKVYRAPKGVSIGGYGEVLFQEFASRADDGSSSERPARFDFQRAILYFGYKWTDRILFNSEVELEHASTGEGGEVSLEFAYVDFLLWGELNLRGGLVLIPMGFINELHEPPVFHGATRPEVERFIVPTTWRENGAGVFGDIGPLRYRSYVVAGLSAEGLSAGAGLRGGRQKGSKSVAEDLAWTGRVDLTGRPGLLLGGSFFVGPSGQGLKTGSRKVIGARVDLFDLHGQLDLRGWRIRTLYARGWIDEAAEINEALELKGADSVGSKLGGGYIEASFDLMSLRAAGSAWSLTPFVRYESYDTQSEVPDGFVRHPANHRSSWTLGLDIKPYPSVVIKLDFQDLRNGAGTGLNRWNLALGYLF